MTQQRILTEQEEQAVRLCHHDFKNLTLTEASRVMRITPLEVKTLLRSAKKKAPQLFPILTPRRLNVLHCKENGMTREETAIKLNMTERQVQRAVVYLYKYKFLAPLPTVGRYNMGMDEQVVERF